MLLEALIWTSLLAYPQTAPAELLRQTADACKRLYVAGYAVDIERRNLQRPHADAGDTRGIPRPTAGGRQNASPSQITMARLGKRFRYEVKNSDGHIWQWTTDGATLWCYRRDLNRYTETTAEPWPEPLGPGSGLPGLEWKYLTKFIALDTIEDRAKLVSDDLARTRECPGPSLLFELQLQPSPYRETERLRILSQSHLPCDGTLFQLRRNPSGGAITESTDWIRWKFRDGPPDLAAVTFTPARGAKKIRGFPRFE